MNTHEAKKDCAARLVRHGISFTKLTAKTVSFEDLARCSSIFITIHGVSILRDDLKAKAFADLPKPSAGGYIIMT